MNMERDIDTFINLVIPTSLLGDSRLTFLERLLLIDILSLCKKKGYCWATNEYFKNLFNVSKQTISKSISSLSKYGYIVLEYDRKEKNNSKRVIRLSEVLKNQILGIKNNLNTSIQENFKQYNKNNTITASNIIVTKFNGFSLTLLNTSNKLSLYELVPLLFILPTIIHLLFIIFTTV